MRLHPGRRRVLVAVAVVIALAATAVAAFRWGAARSDEPAATRPTPSPDTTASLSVAEIYSALLPSVVSVRVRRAGGQPGADGEASGTGLIASADAVILTALHVVEDADDIEVVFADGARSSATLTASDAANDIAVLAPARPPDVIVPAVLGGGVSVGDQVTAIGNQLGLTNSTTSGVVSGLGRSLAREDAPDIDGLIQFDAAVNPGSSGGPLVNADGQTVGIVVALANPTGERTFVGVGFAVPIGTALGAGNGSGQPPQL